MTGVPLPTAADRRIAWLAALAVAIHLLEAGFPSPLPGIKPGLANVVTVASLLLFGWRTAAWVGLLRVLAGSLLLGTFLSPTFFLSLGGAGGSLLAMGLPALLPRHWTGPLGYSVLGALGHMGAQFGIAYALFIPHPGLLRLLPPFLAAALLFGLLGGIIAHAMLQFLDGTDHVRAAR